MMRAGWIGLAGSAAVAVIIGGVSLVDAPSSVTEEHPTTQEPVVRSSLVCPYVDGEDAGTAQFGALALPGVDTATGDDGQQPITVDELGRPPEPDSTEQPTPPDDDAEPVYTIGERGSPLITDVDIDEPTGLSLTGTGELAAGMAAEQSLIMQESDLRGVSTASCTSPEREHWFVGGSGEVGQRGRLILSNPTDVPAVADIELWDEAGPLDAAGTQDVTVPARSQQVFLLDALAPGSAATGVHVNAEQGRVSAAMEMRETDEITPQGMSFIPAASAPAEGVIVPGIPGHGERTLRIVAPGETDAIVSMQILGPEGPFSPADQDVVTVPAGSVLDVPLDVVGGDPAGVRLDSDQPVTAAVRLAQTPDEGLPEVAYTAATPALTGPATALLSRVSSDFSSTLMISSVVDTASRVAVRTLAGDGSVANEENVDVPPGATVPVPMEAPGDSSNATVVVEPETPGSVVAAREIQGSDDDGAMVDLMPLVSSPVSVEVPEVAGELPSVPEVTTGPE